MDGAEGPRRAEVRLPGSVHGALGGVWSSGVGKKAAVAVKTACDKHLAVGQQRRRVIIACGVEAAGLCKFKGGARARPHRRQPRTENKQEERDPPRKTQAG